MDFSPDTTFEAIELNSAAYSFSKLSSLLEDLQSSSSGLSQSDKQQLIQSIQQQVTQSFGSQDILTQDKVEELKNDIIATVIQEVMQQSANSGISFDFADNAEDEDEIDIDDFL